MVRSGGDSSRPDSAAQDSPQRVLELRLVLYFIAIVGAITVVALREPLWPHLTGNNDEAVYLYQAELLADGAVTLPADGSEIFFQPWLTGRHGDRIVFAFNPVWQPWLPPTPRPDIPTTRSESPLASSSSPPAPSSSV